MGVALQGFAPQPDLVDERVQPLAACRRGHVGAQRDQALFEDVEDAHARVQGGERILKNDLHGAPCLAQRIALQREEILPLEQGLAANHGLVAQQLDDRLAGGCLAATGFTDQCQRAASGYREGHTVHRDERARGALQQAFANRETHRQIAHLEQCRLDVFDAAHVCPRRRVGGDW